MKLTLRLFCCAALTSLALSACVVAPVGYRHPNVSMEMSEQPTYAVPGPGYVWAFHAHYGWGWHHPDYGWHRGWH